MLTQSTIKIIHHSSFSKCVSTFTGLLNFWSKPLAQKKSFQNRIIWTILNLGKNWFSMTPPPRPKLGKIWNVDYFDIVAPPPTLTKTVPKSHQTDTWGLFHSYIGHKWTKCWTFSTICDNFSFEGSPHQPQTKQNQS